MYVLSLIFSDNRYDVLKDKIKQSKYTMFNLKAETREEEDLQMQKHREMVTLSAKIKFWEDKVKVFLSILSLIAKGKGNR